MPTYEYLCRSCGQQFEVFQSFKDKPLKTHAECGGDVQKVFHASGVVFKGSGFYVTDSRGKKASSGSSSDTGSPSSDSSSAKESSGGSSDGSKSSTDKSSSSSDSSKTATATAKSD